MQPTSESLMLFNYFQKDECIMLQNSGGNVYIQGGPIKTRLFWGSVIFLITVIKTK